MTSRQAEICKELESLQKQQLKVLTPSSANDPQILSYAELEAYRQRHQKIQELVGELTATLR